MHDDFIRALPKTEMHLHIEGSVPLELLRGIDPVKHANPPSSWDAGFRYPDFASFDRHLLGMVMPYFTTPERYHEAAKVIFKRLRDEQNVRYVETSFASGVMEFVGVDGEATADAIKAAAPEGLTVRVFLGIHHNGYNEKTCGFLEDSVNWKSLDGVDLHGAETMPMESWTDALWAKFRDAGKMTKAHAGEFCGPEFVREVLTRLKVNRIEHGEKAARDPKLLDELREKNVTLDLCPISNLKLGVAASFKNHSLRKIFDAGVSCTINTDDPICFGNTLFDDWNVAAAEMGFSTRELARIARNGFRAALVDDATKAIWIDEVDAVEKAFANSEND
ncbi:MAG TPA: adenosine deaminase [Opitutales bacterium]|nr:adenosine deaminase [Opitutales bacterium]